MTTAAEVFEAMPSRLDADAAADINVTIGWDLSGDEETQKTIKIADGAMTVEDGLADDLNATISMDSDDFVAMTTGELNPMMAFMGGKVKVDGDMSAVMKIQNLFG